MYFLKQCSSEWQLYADKGFPGLSGDKFKTVFLNSEVDESGLSRKAHNLEATGSNPVFANTRARRRLTSESSILSPPNTGGLANGLPTRFPSRDTSLSLFPYAAEVAQQGVRVTEDGEMCRFESYLRHYVYLLTVEEAPSWGTDKKLESWREDLIQNKI